MMQMQTGSAWACLPCSFAMAVGIPVEQFIELLGHDGSAKPYPELFNQVAGFHEQECVEILQKLDYACTPIEIVPQMVPFPGGPVRQIWFPTKNKATSIDAGNRRRILRHLKGTCGVITGQKRPIASNITIGHAVAWDGEKIYDPQGKGLIYMFRDTFDYGFTPGTYWKVQNLRGAP